MPKRHRSFLFILKYSLLPRLCFICILVEQLFSILVSELNTPGEISLHSKYLPSLHSVSPPFFVNKAELSPILHTWYGEIVLHAMVPEVYSFSLVFLK